MEAEQVCELVVRLRLTHFHRGVPVNRLRLARGELLGEGVLRRLREVGRHRLQLAPGQLVDQTALGLEDAEIQGVGFPIKVQAAETQVRQALHPAVGRIQGVQLLHAREVAGEHQPALVGPE